ncbi:MAG: SDR family oxidoreductase [Calditrichaeota bacterium]|nr:MAG: SDR family oxidoreductase [Calditrichota bacterium]
MTENTFKTVLITGASRGIGRALALKFAEHNYSLALTGRDNRKLDETAEMVQKQSGKRPLVIPADLKDPQAIRRLADQVLDQWGYVDILVNNAGVLYTRPFLELSDEEVVEMMEVNFLGLFRLTREILPSMIKREHGTIVNIASLAGKHGFRNGTGYAASKFAVRGFAQSLMLEVRDKGVRVITVFPGSVDTEMRSAHSTTRSDTVLQPEDVAHAVFAAVSVDKRAMMSEIDIRPSNPQKM